MAEYTNVAIQTVAVGQNVLFSDIPVHGTKCIVHREGAGITTLRGLTNQCRARFRVWFGGNIAVPTGEDVGPISLALSITGEPLPASSMIVSPTLEDRYFNVSSAAFIDVPAGCCLTVAVENTSTIPVNVQNANLIIERVA